MTLFETLTRQAGGPNMSSIKLPPHAAAPAAAGAVSAKSLARAHTKAADHAVVTATAPLCTFVFTSRC